MADCHPGVRPASPCEAQPADGLRPDAGIPEMIGEFAQATLRLNGRLHMLASDGAG
jgi:hypothetical protein